MGNSVPSLRAITLLCSIGAATAGRTGYPLHPRWTNSSIPNSSTISRSSGPASSSTISISTLSSSSGSLSSQSDSVTVSSSSEPGNTPESSTPGSTQSSNTPATSTTIPLTGSIITTVTTDGTTQVLTLPPSSITLPPVITVDWTKVTTSTTDGVSTATHDSHGWPIIPVLHCWFCPPIGGGGGIIIPGITGPGVLPPPPPDVIKSLGFSSNMPTITLDPEGDPTYPTEEPTNEPTSEPTSSPTDSTTSTSSTSSCTSTTTGYDLYVTCTSITSSALLSSSVSCETSTSTTTGCDITTTATTTTVAACPLSASASINSEYASARAAAGTVVDGTTYPLAFWPTDSMIPGGFTISEIGLSSETEAPSTSSVPSTFSTSISSSSTSSSAPASTTSKPPSTSSKVVSIPDSTSTKSTPTTTTIEDPPQTTSSAPSPTATWYLTAYSEDCDTMKDSSDFSYYSLEGYDMQSPDETCTNIHSDLPRSSDTTNSCSWFEKGGFDGPNSCSSGTFSQPASFVIRGGFCTVYSEPDCKGDHNGVSSSSYTGCTNVDDGWVDLGSWASINCFAYQ
ncbi:hypothetical protein HD806DRAFT_234953 [Xylariaceae sp. AK1471]|nr:hypothetical protein HD806DRAFT_234953 [Xylariaceae sp. AK1471]